LNQHFNFLKTSEIVKQHYSTVGWTKHFFDVTQQLLDNRINKKTQETRESNREKTQENFF